MSATTSPRTTQEPPASPRWTTLVGWLLATLLAVVVLVGVLAGLLRETPTLDASTPDGVVQSYAQAVLDDRYVAAREHLADDLQTRCAVIDFRDAWIADATTVTLERTIVDGDTAAVTIGVRGLAGPGPLDLDSGARTEVLDLVRTGRTWHITGDPWPVYDCGR